MRGSISEKSGERNTERKSSKMAGNENQTRKQILFKIHGFAMFFKRYIAQNLNGDISYML